MAVRRSSNSSLRERARLDPVAPPQAHLIQPRIPGNGPHNNEASISHHNSATDRSSDERGHPPVIKITLYRLLNTMIILGVGTGKFILAMQGHSISPTILDWVLGSLYVVVTYWIGFLEDVRPPVWPWLFSEVRMMPLVRKLFSMVMGAMRHKWEDMKRNWKRELFAILLLELGVSLPFLLPPLDLSTIVFLVGGALWGGICAFVAHIVFPDSSEV